MLNLAKECKKLNSYVHISTTFANLNDTRTTIDEKFYKPAYTYTEIMELVEQGHKADILAKKRYQEM